MTRLKKMLSIALILAANTSVYAQYALDHPIDTLHTKAGQEIARIQCKPGLPLIHLVTAGRQGDKKYPILSITQCVPRSGEKVLMFTCTFATKACTTAHTPQLASDLETDFRRMLAKEGKQI